MSTREKRDLKARYLLPRGGMFECGGLWGSCRSLCIFGGNCGRFGVALGGGMIC